MKQWINPVKRLLILTALLLLGVFFGAANATLAHADDNVSMYRMYNPNSGEHFYTAGENEKTVLENAGWDYEGIGFFAPVSSKTPVYRLYNPNAGDHHYTTSAGERDVLIEVGWNDEGIGWYSDDAKSIPVYRQYNPNAVTGAHNFTTSKGENDSLVSVGWREEGTAFFATGLGIPAQPKPKVVFIDPGHQDHGMSAREPIAPNSSTTKAKLTSGTYGPYSKKNEYQVNLEVSLKLRDILESRGYTVKMSRTTNNVNISNAERAQMATAAHADILVRIHCNSVDASSVHGVLCYVPSANNPYLKPEVARNSITLGKLLGDAQCEATGQKRLDDLIGNDMTGINWATMPVAIVEMGFMSNPTEDRNLGNDAYQQRIAEGLANGVDRYFGK